MDKAIELIKMFEGCKLNAYLCPAGKWTIGYGSTGQDIIRDLVWTQEQADDRLKKHVIEVMEDIKKICPQLIGNRLSAIISFVYNVGISNFKKSTLYKKINQRNYIDAAEEFDKWVYGGGQKLTGLVIRRKAEKELFLSDDESSINIKPDGTDRSIRG